MFLGAFPLEVRTRVRSSVREGRAHSIRSCGLNSLWSVVSTLYILSLWDIQLTLDWRISPERESCKDSNGVSIFLMGCKVNKLIFRGLRWSQIDYSHTSAIINPYQMNKKHPLINDELPSITHFLSVQQENGMQTYVHVHVHVCAEWHSLSHSIL